jgi:hypothetical protein
MTVRNVALDPGFGGAKAAEVQNGEIKVVTVPSVVGIGSTEVGMLDLAGVTGRRRRCSGQPLVIAFEGIEYLVGHGVAEYTRPVERLDFHRLSDGPELRALTYATLFELLADRRDNGTVHDINLVVGLPVEVLQGPDAHQTVKVLRRWLEGEHRFGVDGQEATFNVHTIRPMAQPVGAFFQWGLSLDGQWSRDKADFMLPVAVLDLGFNTLDLLGVKGGTVQARYTGGDTLGMRRAATVLADSVRRQYRRSMSLHEADAYLRDYIRGNGRRRVKMPTGGVDGGWVDIRPLVRSALDTAGGQVMAFVERTWSNGRQFSHLLLTGGGCLALGDRLKQQFGHAILFGDPVTANAQGLARLAQRRGLFNQGDG